MTILQFLFNVSGAALVAATVPLLADLLPLSLAALVRPRVFEPAPAPDFRLAVIIPAHNEQRLIAACVQSLLASANQGTIVYVVAHNCSDLTAQVAAGAGATVLELNDPVGGKGRALDYGFNHALARGAQGVLVIDADSTASANLCGLVSAHLASGLDALQCRYLVADTGQSPRVRLMNLAFLGMNLLRPRGRARLGLSCGIFGNGFALSAATLARVPYVANSVVEDLEYHLHLLRAGICVKFIDGATVLGEMPEAAPAASTQRARWEGGRMLMRRTWSAALTRDVLAGKLRMLEPLLDLRSLPLAIEAVLLVVSLIIPLHWLRVYALIGLLTLVLYVMASALLAPSPAKALKALASAPGYVFWKLMMIPRTRLAARKDARWVRTERNETPPRD